MIDSVSDKRLARDMVLSFARGVFVVCCGVLIAVLMQSFVVERFIVPTGSMLPTIQLNDQILCEKVGCRFGDVNVGDVICFNSDYSGGFVLVKRVIATGGQTVDLRDGRVYVDGEESKYGHGESNQLGSDVTYPITLGADELWVMGDNREESSDSRVFGPINRSSVIGRVFMRVWPPSMIE